MAQVLVLLGITFFYSADAFAYLDPSAWGMAVHSIIAAGLGALVVVRTYWTKIKDLFRRIVRRNES